LAGALEGGTVVVVEFETGKRRLQNDIEIIRDAFDADP
jgi:hypothetical protein